ncbi:MAG: leucine-rich repeat protein, partial [Prolixibacteraceae bacterium]
MKNKRLLLSLILLSAILLYSGCKDDDYDRSDQKRDEISMPGVYNLNADGNAVTKSGKNVPVPREFLEKAKTARFFAINPALQRAEGNVKVNDIIKLQLFENAQYTATVRTVVTNANGNYTLTLKLPDYPMASGMITTSREGKSLFMLKVPELKRTFISSASIYSDVSYLLDADPANELRRENDEVQIPEETVVPVQNDEQTDRENVRLRASGMSADLAPTDPAQIDLMVVYTPAAAEWAASNEGGISNTIEGTMAHTSSVFDNQGNEDKINLVYSGKVNYTEHSADMEADLRNLTGTDDGYMDDVHLLRTQYGADLVVLMTRADDYGGIAWVLNNVNGSPKYGFHVVRVQQTSWTYVAVHELGHNMGMSHNKEDAGTSSLFPYAFGWYWTGNDGNTYGSVMSYKGERIPYYSNPDITCKGEPTGTDVANNAKVFRNTKHVVAAYFAGECTITAVAGAGGSIFPSGEQTVARGDSKILTISANAGYKIAWVFVDGINNTSAVSSKSYTFENVTSDHTIYAAFIDQTAIEGWLIGSPNPEDVQAVLASDGILTISGTGAMVDGFYPGPPWSSYAIKSVAINDGVTTIAGHAFSKCSGITSVSIPNSVTSIGEAAFEHCNGLTTVNLGNSVTTIGLGAFTHCRNLTSVTIPNSVTSIGQSAFNICDNLTSVTIPGSVTSIGNFAFYGCVSLMQIISNSETPPAIAVETFYGVNKDIPVKVPCGSKEAYLTAQHWSSFTNIYTECDQYTITAMAGTGGSISPDGEQKVARDDSKAFSFTADTGYEIEQVLVDGVNNVQAVSSKSFTFTNVTANHTISVSFKKKQYTITASAGSSGSIAPDGEQTVAHGDNKAFSFTADTGYEIEQVLVDGVNNAQAVSLKSYTFTNITANHTISVSFKKKQYTIMVSANPSGYGSAGGAGTYIH